jgi:hypothetical protein
MTDTKAFQIAADMEDDVKAVHDVAIAIARLTEVMHDDQQLAASLNHLAGEIVECTEAVEEQRQRIFKLLHPGPGTDGPCARRRSVNSMLCPRPCGHMAARQLAPGSSLEPGAFHLLRSPYGTHQGSSQAAPHGHHDSEFAYGS